MSHHSDFLAESGSHDADRALIFLRSSSVNCNNSASTGSNLVRSPEFVTYLQCRQKRQRSLSVNAVQVVLRHCHVVGQSSRAHPSTIFLRNSPSAAFAPASRCFTLSASAFNSSTSFLASSETNNAVLRSTSCAWEQRSLQKQPTKTRSLQ